MPDEINKVKLQWAGQPHDFLHLLSLSLALLGNHERIKQETHYKPLNPIFESLDWINVNNRLIPVDPLSNLPISTSIYRASVTRYVQDPDMIACRNDPEKLGRKIGGCPSGNRIRHSL